MSRSLMIIVHVNMILVKSSAKPSIFPFSPNLFRLSHSWNDFDASSLLAQF